MAVLIFLAGQSKTAGVSVDVDPAGLAMQIETWLGPNQTTKVASSGKISFTSTGSAQVVPCPVVMPTSGNHNVYVDVYYQGVLIAAFQATDSISILSVSPPVVVWT